MFSFLAAHPLRTRTVHLSTIPFDDGASRISFHPRESKYLVTNVWPPASNKDETIPGNANNALSPPPHWHSSQSETFHMLAGAGNFVLEGAVTKVSAGDSITIPKGAYHTFCNASTDEGMEVEFVLEPRWRERDERFFRNIQTYRDDCRKMKISQSFPQTLLFLWSGGVFPALPGPKFISKPLAVILTFVGGVVIGKWLLGYQESYPEYSRDEVD